MVCSNHGTPFSLSYRFNFTLVLVFLGYVSEDMIKQQKEVDIDKQIQLVSIVYFSGVVLGISGF